MQPIATSWSFPNSTCRAMLLLSAVPILKSPVEARANGNISRSIPARKRRLSLLATCSTRSSALFPSPYIHIGGDEVHYGNQSWFTDPEIQQFIKDKNLGNETGLEQYFIRRAADIVASKGKTMIGWDEMIDAGVSPDKAVIMWWRHDRKHQLVKALENGYRVIMTPRRPLYADFIQYGGHKVGRVWGGYNTIEDIYRFP